MLVEKDSTNIQVKLKVQVTTRPTLIKQDE